jgi:phage gpG-like protein
MLKKRSREGFILKPIVIEATSDDDAKEIEMLLIQMIGRDVQEHSDLWTKLFHGLQLYADGENSRAIGTNVPYGPIHNFGLGHMPRRQFLGFGDEDATVVERLIIKRITEALK